MPNRIIRFQLLLRIICLFIFIPVARPQQASLWLPTLTSCIGNQVTVSLTANNLLDIGAITLNIGYDTSVLEYLGHGNTNLQFPGIMTNAVVLPQSQVGIVWSSLTPGNISSGILLDLYFRFRADSCRLTFNPDCDITDVNFMPVAFDSVSGKVYQAPPYLTQNPQSVTVMEGENAVLSVSASAADTYEWQEWNGAAWSGLTNSGTYQNVNSPQLTIVAAPLSLNEYSYRCLLSANGGCQVLSDPALLLVMPLPVASLSIPDTLACPLTEIKVPLRNSRLENIVGFSIEIAYDTLFATFFGLSNTNPLLDGITASVSMLPVPHVKLEWSSSQGTVVPEGNLTELVFGFLTDNSPLLILNTSFISRADNILYALETQNGSLAENPEPVIWSSPSDTTVLAGAMAYFNVMAPAALDYQWLESADNGISWQGLNDVDPYTGTHTQSLTINPASLTLNHFEYKCAVSGSVCVNTSEPATLTIDTLTTSTQARIEKHGKKLLDVISQKIDSDGLSVVFVSEASGTLDISVFDLQGRMMHRSQHAVYSAERQRVEEKVSGLPGGAYLIVYSLSNATEVERFCNKTFFVKQ
jgi:hypothetical protein